MILLVAQGASDDSGSALALALVAGAFTVLGVILTLTGTLLSNRQNAKHAADTVLRSEQREEKRVR